MRRTSSLARLPVGLLGAACGGAVGYFAFRWIAAQGFYAMVLPGALVGIGFYLCERGHSWFNGILCGLLGVAAGLFCEWRVFPFVADDSLEFFVKNLGELRPITMLMIAIGGLLAFYFGKGRSG